MDYNCQQDMMTRELEGVSYKYPNGLVHTTSHALTGSRGPGQVEIRGRSTISEVGKSSWQKVPEKHFPSVDVPTENANGAIHDLSREQMGRRWVKNEDERTCVSVMGA